LVLKCAEREGFVTPLKTALFQYVTMDLILYSPNYSPLLIYLGIAANAIHKYTKRVAYFKFYKEFLKVFLISVIAQEPKIMKDFV
jgi:hypothetical protein